MSERKIILNPDEPRAGDYAYGLYDKAHPIYGEQETIAYLRGQLRGLRGETVKMTLSGVRIDENDNQHRFTVTRTFTLNRYSDVFGSGSAYGSAIRQVREKHSSDTIVAHTLTIVTV